MFWLNWYIFILIKKNSVKRIQKLHYLECFGQIAISLY